MSVISHSLGAIYSAGRLYDNFRYWSDYRKNTGKSPKYPIRAGLFSDYGMSYMVGSEIDKKFDKRARKGRGRRRRH